MCVCVLVSLLFGNYPFHFGRKIMIICEVERGIEIVINDIEKKYIYILPFEDLVCNITDNKKNYWLQIDIYLTMIAVRLGC